MSLTKTTYSMIQGAVVNVLDIGAVANGDGIGGGTDNSGAIQLAIDRVVATGKPGTVYIPGSGIYCCNTGLTLDLSLCSLKSDGATLDFTNMPGGVYADYTLNGFGGPLVGVALTVTSSYGYAGGAYYEATQRVSGIRIKGKNGTSEGGIPPAPNNDQAGIYLHGTSYTQVSALFENVVISQFYHGAIFGENEFGSTWLNCAFVFNGTCVYMPQVNNAGERNNFIASTFYASVNGFALYNAFATTFIQGCSIGGISSVYVYITQGFLTLDSCHFEGNFAPDYPNAVMLWNDNVSFPGYSIVSVNGCEFLAKTQRANHVIRLDGAIMFNMTGGYIDGSTAGSVAVIGGSAASAGNAQIRGTWILNGTNAPIDITMGLYASRTFVIDLADPIYLNNVAKNQVYRTAAPTADPHLVGEIVWNTAPTAGGTVGWVCTTAGTPGTWKTFGLIET